MALAADHQVVVDGDAQRSRRVLLGHGASLRTSVSLSLVLLACDFREWKPAEITRYRGQPIEAPQDGLVDTLSPRAFDSVINVCPARHRLLRPGCRPAVDRAQARGYDPFDLNQLSLARQSLHGSVGKPPRLVCFPWCGAWLPNGVPRESALSWSPLDSFLPPARRRGATWTQQNTKRRSRASLYGEWDGTLSSPMEEFHARCKDGRLSIQDGLRRVNRRQLLWPMPAFLHPAL